LDLGSSRRRSSPYFIMSLHAGETSRKLKTASATPSAIPSPHQPPCVELEHLSQVPTSPQHGKIDHWTHLLGEETVAKFKELARHFEEQDSVDDVLNWNQHL